VFLYFMYQWKQQWILCSLLTECHIAHH